MEFEIERARHRNLVDIKRYAALIAVKIRAAKPLRSVGIVVGGLIYGNDRLIAHRFAAYRSEVVDRKLIDKALPFVVVVIDLRHLEEMYIVFCVGLEVAHRLRAFNVSIAREIGLQLGGSLEPRIAVGISVPIGARHIHDRVRLVAVVIYILQSIADDLAGGSRARVRDIIRFGKRRFDDHIGVTRHGLALNVEQTANASRAKHIVERVVTVRSDSEIIIALIEYIAAFFARVRAVDRVFVVYGKKIIVDDDRHRLVLTPCKLARLAEADELNGGLFRHALLVRELSIELYGALGFAVVDRRTVVDDLYLSGELVLIGIPYNALDLLRKIGIRKPVTEGICHFGGVTPLIVLGRINALGTVCAVYAEHLVLIASFVIFVADIDIFGVNHIAVFVLLAVVGELKVAEVAHRGRGHRVCRIGVAEMSRKIRIALYKVDEPDKADVARRAECDARVNAVCLVLYPLKVHRKRTVDEHHRLAELARRLYHLEKIRFLLVQRQKRHAVRICGGKVDALAAVPRKHDKRHVVIPFGIGVFERVGIKARRLLAYALLGHGRVGNAFTALVGVIQRFVDLESAVLERIEH